MDLDARGTRRWSPGIVLLTRAANAGAPIVNQRVDPRLEIDDQVMVQGRFTLTRYNLRDRDPELAATDAALVEDLRELPRRLDGIARAGPLPDDWERLRDAFDPRKTFR